MKFSEDSRSSVRYIKQYQPTGIYIDDLHYQHHAVIKNNEIIKVEWSNPSEPLDQSMIDLLSDNKPELVIIGTGGSDTPINMRLAEPFLCAGIGCEVMPSDSACRTYNIVATENRKVNLLVYLPG